MGDRAAEFRACAALATDFRKQGIMGKAIYFYVLQGHLSVEVHFYGLFINAIEISSNFVIIFLPVENALHISWTRRLVTVQL